MPDAPRQSAIPGQTVMLTRHESASARFAEALRRAAPDVPVLIAPLMRIVPLPHDSAALRCAPAVVLTSPEAVPACGPGAGRLALCVGQGTAAAAAAAGFAVQTGATGEAGGLLPLIAACPTPLIHPHGRHLARVLPVPGMVVYDQQVQPLPDAAQAFLAGAAPVILPLFSPRSARLAAQVMVGARAPLTVLAISEAAAMAWGRAPAPAVAARPDGEAMLRLVLAHVGLRPPTVEQSPP